MHLPRRRRTSPVQRISIAPPNSAEAFHTLSNLVFDMNETVQSLWDTVHELRFELGTVRPQR